MKINFKCGNHNVEVSNLGELHLEISYGGKNYLVGEDGKILKRIIFCCPVCGEKLHTIERKITQDEHKQETKKAELIFK